VASYSPPIYYNDQAHGLHGFKANGRWYDSDTFWGTWADDGAWYVQGNDFGGVSNAHSNNVGVVKLAQADGLNITQLGKGTNSTGPREGANYPTTYTADGARPYSEGLVSVRGNMYQYLPRFGGTITGNTSANACTTIIKTTDHWATTVGPQINTGPRAKGLRFSSGFYSYPVNQAGCSMPLTMWFHAAQYCQDWGGANGQFACTHNAGADGWVYAFNPSPAGGFLMRVRVEDIQITEPSMVADRYQVYTGTGRGSDGLLDANWVTYDGVTGTNFGLAIGVKPQLHWVGTPFNRWAALAWAAPLGTDLSQSGSILIYDLGAYPWAINDAVLVGSIPKDTVTYSKYYPVFPNLMMPTYTDRGNGTARVRMSTTGSFQEFQRDSQTANTDRYSPVYRDLVFAPRAGAVARQYIGNGRGQHTGSGLDLLYTFDGASFDTTLPNRASPSPVNTTTGLTRMSYSGQGMNGFGFPDGIGYTPQRTVTITTPYRAALTDFTVFLTFQHDSNGTTPNGETVLDKGDLRVFRNATAPNSWKVLVGGTTSPVFALATDGTFATLIVRRVGSAVTLYGSGGIEESLPLAALSAFTEGTALGPNALTLGSLAGGSQPFYGTLAELAIFSRGLSDAELIREVAAARADMAARNPSVTIP
jgi:hypothetical protein